VNQEIRTAFRSLLRSPAFFLTGVASIGLALCAGVAGFSVLDAIRFRALPFPTADRLVVLGEVPVTPAGTVARECRGSCAVTWSTYSGVLRDRPLRTLDAVMASTPGGKVLTTDGDVELLNGGVVSPNVFAVMEARALHGRVLLPTDDRLGVPLVTVLSHGLWTRRFGADPGVIGRVIKLSDSHYTVVGVMGPGFEFESGSQFWLPAVPTLDPSTRPSITSVFVFGRLAPGRTIEQLRAELATLELPASPQDPTSRVRLVADPLRERYAASAQSNDILFAAIVACILLIACANVGNLALVRALHSQREFAIRSALGASRHRLITPVLAQNAIIIGIGAVVGIAAATSLLGVLRALPVLGGTRPAALDYRMDARALGFAVFACAVAWVIISVLPARLARPRSAQESLRAGASGPRLRGWVRRAFVVVQIACVTVLVAGALLMGRTVREAAHVEVGFTPEPVLTASASYPHPWRVPELYIPVTDRILAELRQLPGVATAALRAPVPLVVRSGGGITPEGHGGPLAAALVPAAAQSISPDYFRALQIPLLAGRDFDDGDRAAGVEVAIVNAWAAERWWPGQVALGRTIRIDQGSASPVVLTVVGVVANNKAAAPGLLFAQDGAELYRPYAQAPSAFPLFVARAQGRGETLVRPVRELLVRHVPDRPVFAAPLEQSLGQQFAGVRRNALQIGAFAVMGLILALIGVYGVLSFEVGRRVREIGIRGALGATRAHVARLVLLDALRMTAVGLVLGIPAALAAARLLQAILFRTSPSDPLTYVAVSLCVAAVALGAAYLPARRAARVSPLVALRTD
jgi:predicted permease